MLSDKVSDKFLAPYGSSFKTNILLPSVSSILVTVLFFYLQNLRSFWSFLCLMKKGKIFYLTVLGVQGVIVYYNYYFNIVVYKNI